MRTNVRPAAAALVAIALAVPVQAAGAEGPGTRSGGDRQTFSSAFDTAVPAQPAGLTLEIDYFNPDDPSGKPPAVREIMIRVPSGARVSTSAVPACDAPDPVLVLLGASACPEGSVLGHGELTLHTGTVGSEDTITLINAPGQLVFITRPKEAPVPGGVVTRSSVEDDSVFRTRVPPIPGVPPPDAFTALDHARLVIERRVGPDGAYLTTPPSCPPEGAWITEASFTYHDGVVQSATSASPCDPRHEHPAEGAVPGGCLPRTARVSSAGLAGVRVGQRRARVIQRAGAPAHRSRGALRYCVEGGGRVLLSFARDGRLRLVATTALRHRIRRIGVGTRVSNVRRRFGGTRRLGPGLLTMGRSSRVVLGHRSGRVTFVAVAGRREARRPALVRYHLRRAGIR